MPLGSSPLLQPAAKTERRTTKIFKERAAEAVAHQIQGFAKALGFGKFKIGPDGRLWWADPTARPTMGDRKVLLYILANYGIQASTHKTTHLQYNTLSN